MDELTGSTTVYHIDAPNQLQPPSAESSAVALVDYILAQALRQNASDIHLQPTEHNLVVRLRVDGILHEALTIDPQRATEVVARVKVLAGLDIAVQRIAQDGRLKVARNDAPESIIDIRVASFPAIYGQQLVLRILDRSHALRMVQSLGLREEHQKILTRAVAQPYGMVLVTGPTGSGKTTTLYALLMGLDRNEKHIITIEEPVEYELPGITQSQVNKLAGFTFQNGLSAILRQDPDVILIGEIRDQDTVQIAVQSALTGHLVLSTLHTNDAPSTITRLRDMQMPAYLINAALSCVVAQRLARILCSQCKTPTKPSSDLATLCKQQGVPCKEVYEPRGCNDCNHVGYRGRIGLFEVLVIDDQIAELISQGAATATLRQAAHKQGMQPMLHDGLYKVASGIISPAELSKTLVMD